MQRVEVRVDAEYHCLAVGDRLLAGGDSERRFNDRRLAVAPVVAGARDQAHAVPVAMNEQSIAVVLRLVQPVGAVGDCGGPSRKAKIEGVHLAGNHVAVATFPEQSSNLPKAFPGAKAGKTYELVFSINL